MIKQEIQGSVLGANYIHIYMYIYIYVYIYMVATQDEHIESDEYSTLPW